MNDNRLRWFFAVMGMFAMLCHEMPWVYPDITDTHRIILRVLFLICGTVLLIRGVRPE